jgi:hypothetical protein
MKNWSWANSLIFLITYNIRKDAIMNFYSTKVLWPMVAVLIFFSVFSWNTSGGEWNTMAIAETTSAPPINEQFKPGEPLQNATTTFTSPINKNDYFSGKPIKDGDETILYKGYMIAFCCNVSKQKWDGLSEASKDNFVRFSLYSKNPE